jgi:hypothetical protein
MIYFKTHKLYYAIAIVALMYTSCTTKQAPPDVSGIKVNINAIRFDELVFKIDTNAIKQNVIKLSQAHPLFMEVYAPYIAGWGNALNINDTFINTVKHFITYKDYVGLQKSIEQKFSSVNNITADVNKMYQYIKYYLPNKPIPSLYYFNGGLNKYSAVTYGDSLIAVGLDMYLGKDYEYYQSSTVQVPAYKLPHCEPAYILPNLAANIYTGYYPFVPEEKNLLQLIIEKGKQLYFMHKVLPTTTDELITGYTPAQLKWCTQNIDMIWSMFKANDLLYVTNLQRSMPFVLEGPSSQGLPPEAPGGVGCWIGYQIVKQYMQKNTSVTPSQLFTTQIDAVEFLTKSGFTGRAVL